MPEKKGRRRSADGHPHTSTNQPTEKNGTGPSITQIAAATEGQTGLPKWLQPLVGPGRKPPPGDLAYTCGPIDPFNGTA